MNKNLKKTLSLVLAVLMVVAVIPFSGTAAEECTEHTYDYSYHAEGRHIAECTVCKALPIFEYCSGGTATCTKGAICEKCSTEYTEVDADNHGEIVEKAEEKYIATAATCQAPATYYKSCKDCGAAVVTETFIAGAADLINGHKYDTAEPAGNGTHSSTCLLCKNTVANIPCSGGEATCTEKAVCEFCDTAYGEADGDHPAESIKTIAKVDSTCQKEGNEAYKYCEACKKAIEEIVVIGKKAHVFTNYVKDTDADTHTAVCDTCTGETKATDTKDCSGGTATCFEKAECSVCGSEYGEMLDHNWKLGEKTEPTCTTEGNQAYYCDNEGCVAVKNEPIEVIAHNFDQRVPDEKFLKTPATCQDEAVYYMSCKCGALPENLTTATVFFGAKAPHSFTAEIVKDEFLKAEATCTVAATYYKTCEFCGDLPDTLTDAATFTSGETAPHQYIVSNTEETLRLPASCTQKAIYSTVCKVCGTPAIPEGTDTTDPFFVIKEGEFSNGPALGHDYQLSKEKVEPSCIAEGTEAVYTCSRNCEEDGHTIGGEPIAKLDHILVKVRDFKAPTCVQDGQLGYSKCERCGINFYTNGESGFDLSTKILALGHTDTDGDMTCDRELMNSDGTTYICGSILEESDLCNCICHSTGIMYFVAVIIKWFWSITGMRPYCACGIAHYEIAE